MHENRTLIRGDNLTEMRNLPDACIDLIATDPPFNSKRDYFVPFRDEHGREPDTLVRAFTDTWTWGEAAEDAYNVLLVDVGGQVGDTIQGLRQFLNETPMMAYLVMMGIRIVEMHRLLKDTGSLYLHCDPTASHYLKIILDAVFGTKNFRNEIVWSYRRWPAKHPNFQRMHDTILRYAKSENVTWNQLYEPRPASTLKRFGTKKIKSAFAEDGKRIPSETMGEESDGVPLRDVWEIGIIAPSANERTGYPTQKPIELYKRIIAASSNEGDLILDPFCGCGTTLMASEELDRHWIGIDLTYLAIGAVRQQFERLFPQHRDSVTIAGTPENVDQALALARTDPQGFEEWCVTHVLHFKSNAKKVADGGIDGTFRFPLGRVKGKQAYGRAVAQVKGGGYTLGHIRDFRTAMQNESADLGVFVVTSPPSSGMRTEASRAGTYRHPSYEMEAPALQIYEIQDYFNGVLPKLPFGERALL
jgi:site-specific DNA-methyltransferase (adenine-specific)